MKKRYYIVFGIITALIGFRIYLPFLLTNYVNKTIDKIPEYEGHINDIDIHLYRGAYQIDSIDIVKTDGLEQTPFFSAKSIDLSIQWNALFQGSIVGEVIINNPVISFIDASENSENQYGADVDWTKPLKQLMPVRINRFVVHQGIVHFYNFSSKPKVDLFLKALDLEAINLSNSTDSEKKLPSSIKLTATSIGDGVLHLDGGINLMKKIPDMDLNLKFENANITAFNDFLKVYSKVDAENGIFNLYSEIGVDSAQLKGYVKPILKDLEVFKWKEDKEHNIFRSLWEAVAGLVLEVVENQEKDQVASKVPFEGNLKDTDVKTFEAIWNIFINAFVEAFKNNTDDTINLPLNSKTHNDS